MERTERDIVAFADLNHDGKAERVVFGLEEYAESGEMEYGILKVLDGMDKNAPVLWEQDYGTVHPARNMLYLYQEDDGELAYSTPEASVTLQHSHMEWCSGWNVANSENALEIFQMAVEKNWLETEEIRILCGIAEGWQTCNIDLSIKGTSRESMETEDMMQSLFGVLSEDNWKYLPEGEMPREAPDVLITISRVPACDIYISRFAEKELAVIWSAPYVKNPDNQMESVCECYHLSKAVIEEIISRETQK